MNMEEILSKIPRFVVSLTMSNKELEKALETMIQEETGISIKMELSSEWGNPQYIMAASPSWELLSNKDREALEQKDYSFELLDDDIITGLVEHLFKADSTLTYIEIRRTDMDDENRFNVEVLMDIDHFTRLKKEVNHCPGS